jgi:hypothetical protein
MHSYFRLILAASLTCGPTPPPHGVAKPSVSGLDISINHILARTGPVSPGADLGVTWMGKSDAGLWQTGAVISGAFSARVLFIEGMAPASGRGAWFRVPQDAKPGSRIIIEVFAVDPFLQTTVVSPPDTFWVREAIP